MSEKQLQSNDYTVGWICALPTEAAAAIAMLDEEHPELPLDRNDNNAYSFGRIGPHNIVIGYLPAGQYGLVSAAAVALQMKSSFRSLRMGLMVGIGGGVPGVKDIRLGDVVVSQPDGQHGGVIQYDLGKTIANGQYVRTGQLNSPPEVLLTALSKIQTAQRLRRTNMSAYLSKIEQDYPDYAHPNPLPDRLYKTTHHHKGEDDCSCCGEDQVEKRNKRRNNAPVIHYGTIASGNQVMRDPVKRDVLSKDLGGVLCFEMEAAGLMNRFPCIVIRGIADYADSHKNDGWHDYAAAVAAAFAKDLLAHVAAERLTEMETIQNTMGELSKKVEETNKSSRRVEDRIEYMTLNAHQEKVLTWLSAPDPSINYQAALKKHHGDTGSWFLQSKSFRRWKEEHNSFLWLYGLPGCGKTVLSSTVVQHLQNEGCDSVIYYYFDFGDSTKQTLDGMVRSLARQLYRHNDALRSGVEDLYRACSNGDQTAPTDKLVEALQTMISKLDKVFIVLDALDESRSETQGELLAVVKGLRGINSSSLRFIMTSRQEGELGRAIGEWREKEQLVSVCCQESKDDIHNYISARIGEDAAFRDWQNRPDLQEEVRSLLIEKADGMFRYAACMLDLLKHCPNEYSLRDSLKNLPRDLQDVYAHILKNLSDSPYEREATLILQFVTWSVRPMRVPEIIDALAVRPEADPPFKLSQRMFKPMKILEMCSSLVVLVKIEDDDTSDYGSSEDDDASDHGSSDNKNFTDGNDEYSSVDYSHWQLQLAHSTVKEYFTSGHVKTPFQQPLEEMSAKATIVITCLSYLSSIDFPLDDLPRFARSCLDPYHSLGQTGKTFPLSNYSLRYWTDYARFAEPTQERMRALVLRFVQDNRSRAWFVLSFIACKDTPWLSYTAHEVSEHSLVPLTFVASKGLLYTARALILSGSDVNIDHSSSIHAASYNGHLEIVRLLVENGARVNEQSMEIIRCNPLTSACHRGHKDAVQFLLDHGADVNARDDSGNTALQEASEWGHTEIVKLLLDYRADVNARDDLGNTALQKASNRGRTEIRTEIVKLLLDHRADVNARDDLGNTALQSASIRGHMEIVKLLLDYRADVNARDDSGNTALEKASEWGYTKIVKLLLDHRADVNARDDLGNTALQKASGDGYMEIVKLLLDHRADVNARDDSGNTALNSVVRKYGFEGVERVETMKVLLDYGADTEVISGYNRMTALEEASSRGFVDMVQMLLDHGANLGLSFPLASLNGRIEVLRTLARHPEYGSAIEAAARMGKHEIVRILRNRGAEIGNALEEAFDALSNPTDTGLHEYVLQLLLHDRRRQRMRY